MPRWQPWQVLPLALGTRWWGGPLPPLNVACTAFLPRYLQGSGPGPGTYRLRSSIDEGLRRRRAGGLGPCQTFSGDRSKLGRGGHHALEVRCPGVPQPARVSHRAVALSARCSKGGKLPYASICPTWILLFDFPWRLEKYTCVAAFWERAGCRQRAGERAGAREQWQG